VTPESYDLDQLAEFQIEIARPRGQRLRLAAKPFADRRILERARFDEDNPPSQVVKMKLFDETLCLSKPSSSNRRITDGCLIVNSETESNIRGLHWVGLPSISGICPFSISDGVLSLPRATTTPRQDHLELLGYR
jgi:hypothetical protein